MKRRFVPTLIATAVIPASLLLMSNWNGPEARSSGSPLENGKTCTQCHGGTANSGSGNLTITGAEETYKAGETYTFTVNVNDEMSSKFGFQAVAVDGSDMATGSFMSGMDMEIYRDGGDEYIQHSRASESGMFTFDWTAPDSDQGDITLYVAGNASNSDGKVDGDLIYTSMVTMTSDATSVGDIDGEEISVYPNPSNGVFVVDFGGADVDQVNIYSLAGELVYANNAVINTINLNDMEHGIYLLKAQVGDVVLTKKLIVQ